MKKVIINKATAKDLNELAQLALALRKNQDKISGLTSYTSTAQYKKYYTGLFRKQLRSKQSLLLVARKDKKIIAYLFGIIKDMPAYHVRKNIGFINEAFVAKNYRRQGVLKILLKELFIWFKSKKINRVELSVFINNQVGKTSWHKAGFKEYRYICQRKI
jgi:ribosomal protein S18 acetylase RimI-like enzyme